MKPIAKTLLLFLCSCCSYLLYGQNVTISGVLKDSSNASISYASIIASTSYDEKNIIAYTTSKNDGVYSLNMNSSTQKDSIWISFRHISHQTKRIKIKLSNQTLNTVLLPKKNRLDEVLVKAKKNISVKGDTITYNVSGLKKVKDYTIEEVIDRIPGVSISENGQIKYKNKPISHFYINGVDLLEGRYNIATRGIPANAFADIEILKRHNHARIDKGITNSDDVAFNLKIKENKNLIFGSAKGDIGLPLLTANVEATPIIIRDKTQDIASVKANNIGQSLEFNGTNLTRSNEDFSAIKFNKLSILKRPNTNGSGLNQKSWLDNESWSVTNDILLKNKKEKLFKIGATYSDNTSRIERKSNNTYFFGSDSTIVDRASVDNLRIKNYYVGLVQEINKKQLYFKNKTTFKGEQSQGISSIIQNNLPLDYNYNNKNFHLSNESEFKINVANKILNNGLLLEYINTDETTTTLPSVFQNTIPSNFLATNTRQDISATQFNLGAFSSYKFRIGKTNWLLKQRFNFKSENLQTDLSQQNSTEDTNLAFPFVSDFNLNTFKSLTSLNFDYKVKRFTFNMNPEVEFISLDQNETLNTNLDKVNEYLFLQPKLNIGYKFSETWNMGYGFQHMTSVSEFSQLNNSLVLVDFSNLTRNPSLVNVQRSLKNNLYIGYKNILRGFFFNNSTSIDRNKSDFTFVSAIDENGLLEVNAIERPNTLISFNNTTRLTKRFFKILSSDLSYNYLISKSEQIFNNLVQENKNTLHTVRLELDLDNETWYGFNYNGSFSFGTSEVDEFNTTNTFLNHNFELDFYTSEKSRMTLS